MKESTLVARLRNYHSRFTFEGKMAHEAADELERLSAGLLEIERENEVLREQNFAMNKTIVDLAGASTGASEPSVTTDAAARDQYEAGGK